RIESAAICRGQRRHLRLARLWLHRLEPAPWSECFSARTAPPVGAAPVAARGLALVADFGAALWPPTSLFRIPAATIPGLQRRIGHLSRIMRPWRAFGQLGPYRCQADSCV